MTEAGLANFVFGKMMENDRYSKWLGLKLDTISAGHCKLHFSVREEMTNGFDTIHGGVLFAACDSAFAFACNAHGQIAVALEANVNFTRAAKTGDLLSVEAKEVFVSQRTAIYEVRVMNESQQLVCFFKGTAYRTKKAHVDQQRASKS